MPDSVMSITFNVSFTYDTFKTHELIKFYLGKRKHGGSTLGDLLLCMYNFFYNWRSKIVISGRLIFSYSMPSRMPDSVMSITFNVSFTYDTFKTHECLGKRKHGGPTLGDLIKFYLGKRKHGGPTLGDLLLCMYNFFYNWRSKIVISGRLIFSYSMPSRMPDSVMSITFNVSFTYDTFKTHE